MHLFSNNLSTRAMISTLIMLELFPAFISCSKFFILSQSSSGSDDKNIVFDIREATIAGDLSNFMRVRSRVDFLPRAFTSNYISFAKSYNNFLSAKLARSTL